LAGTAFFPGEKFEEWLKTQNDSTTGERGKIINTVNTFFIIKYESWLKEKLLDFGFLFNQTDSAAFEDYAYERGLLHLMLTAWLYSNSKTLLNHYDYDPTFCEVSISKNNAKVTMKPSTVVIFRDNPKNVYDGPWTEHAFELVNQNGCWLIQSIRCDDPTHNIHPRGSDFNKLAATLIKRTEAYSAKEKAKFAELLSDPRVASRALQRLTGVAPLGYRAFSTNKCRTYALDYALNYNTLFQPYDSDCANFVSQCIWYGYGGQNEENPIENHDLPMIDDDIDAITWWCDSAGHGTWNNRHCWTVVNDFLYMITRNYDQNNVGLQGYRGFMAYVLIGDIIKQRTASHVFIVSNIINHNHDYDTDWNEIYVSAHTTDRRDRRLSTLYESYYYVYFYLNVSFKDPS